jgi:phage gpG-like protein
MTAINITLNDRTPELFQKLQAGIERFVVKGSAHLQGELRASMAAPKHGRLYGRHRASAPGESPAVDSGNLITSIAIVSENSLEAKIGTPVEYAAYLEHGTSRMAARPLWERTARKSLPTLDAILAKEIGAGRATVGVE